MSFHPRRCSSDQVIIFQEQAMGGELFIRVEKECFEIGTRDPKTRMTFGGYGVGYVIPVLGSRRSISGFLPKTPILP